MYCSGTLARLTFSSASEFFPTERDRLLVVVRTYNFKINTVAHWPPSGSGDSPLRSLDQPFNS